MCTLKPFQPANSPQEQIPPPKPADEQYKRWQEMMAARKTKPMQFIEDTMR